MDNDWAGHISFLSFLSFLQPGSAGRSLARRRKKPNAFAASAADDSGLSNLPLAISLPGAAFRIDSISEPGTPGRNLPLTPDSLTSP